MAHMMMSVALLGLAGLAVWAAWSMVRQVFGFSPLRELIRESAARVVPFPTGSAAVLRRRFARAVTGQVLIFPSGAREAFGLLEVRISPEDLVTLADSSVTALSHDATQLYERHAQREKWRIPDRGVRVIVSVDETLRSGWIPPARSIDAVPLEHPGTPEAGSDPKPAASLVDTLGLPRLVAEPTMPDEEPATIPADLPEWASEATVSPLTLIADDGDREFTSYPIFVGRGADADFLLSSERASRSHARIYPQQGRWVIEDLGSLNGTFLDGKRLESGGHRVISHGSELTFADVRVEVRVEQATRAM